MNTSFFKTLSKKNDRCELSPKGIMSTSLLKPMVNKSDKCVMNTSFFTRAEYRGKTLSKKNDRCVMSTSFLEMDVFKNDEYELSLKGKLSPKGIKKGACPALAWAVPFFFLSFSPLIPK